MGSVSDFSSGGSGHDDSDTIVISSKSRILISPRKKGSKAVSKLLGSAAEDVVEQLLRGSTGETEVVSRTKRARVHVGHNVTDVRTCANARLSAGPTKQKAGSRNTQPPGEQFSQSGSLDVNESTRELDESVNTASDHDSVCGGSSNAELSAPSSGSDANDQPTQLRAAGQSESRQRSYISASVNAANGSETVKTRRQLQRHQHHESDPSSSDSDASNSTKSSSLYHPTQLAGQRRQRKFDDHIRLDADPTHPSSIRNRRVRSHGMGEMKTAARDPSTNQFRRGRRSERTKSIDLDDSVILPTSATQEMEDLKQTLKNLASHDPAVVKGPSGDLRSLKPDLQPNKPKVHSAGAHSMNQLAESTSLTHNAVTWSATAKPPKVDELKRNKIKSSQLKSHYYSDENYSDSDEPEQSIARRLFSTPPPQRSSSKFSTPPTVPMSSLLSKRTPQSTPSSTANGYSSVLNTSLTAAATSSAQGSRAVLSALKALQDKIRRLEEEREQLMQELSDVKVRARKREAEITSAEKQFAYELGQTKESARAAYDALRGEREELKLELVKCEERKKAMEAELKHASKLTSTFSNKADDLQAQLHTSESQRKSQHAEIDAMRASHKQEVRDLKGELLALQKEKESVLEQNKLLQAQFDRETLNHAETRERLHEAEQTVSGISQLNQKLVAKVWEANEIASKATKRTRKLQQSQRVSTLSRPTAASRAASISGANGSNTPGRPGSVAPKKTRTSTISARGSLKKRTDQSFTANNLEIFRAANHGRDIPFVLGTSANKSHSIISNVQEAMRQCDTTYAMPATNPPPAPLELKPRKNSHKSRKSLQSAEGEHTIPHRMSASASILGLETPITLVGSRTRAKAPIENDVAGEGCERSSKRPSEIRVPTPATAYPNPMKSHIMEDLQAAVQNAEAEFKALNRKYKGAVATVESGRDGAAQLSSMLAPMLDELEAKGKQLNLLKQVYEQASQSTINPVRHIVHSPEAIRRKTASLKILNDYRQLEREVKSPRSAVTTPGVISPTGTNTASRRASFFSDDA